MKQLYAICFDVTDKKRLRQVAIQMENFGQRVQYSLFECYLDEQELQTLKNRLEKIIHTDKDHVRYYSICNKDKNKIQIDGKGTLTPQKDYHLY